MLFLLTVWGSQKNNLLDLANLSQKLYHIVLMFKLLVGLCCLRRQSPASSVPYKCAFDRPLAREENKPLAVSDRLMISVVQVPLPSPCQFNRPYPAECLTADETAELWHRHRSG